MHHSIKGTEAKMENLGKLSDNSGGQVGVHSLIVIIHIAVFVVVMMK